jgi:hypothetical protein
MGAGTNSIAYSYDDGLTWTGIGTTIFTSGNGIGYNDKIWVGVGNGSNTIAISSDGINWTGLGTTIFTYNGLNVIWDGNQFIAVGSGTNNIATSTDGINWNGLGNIIFDGSWESIYFNGSLYVGVGGSFTSNTIAYSYDSLIWHGLGANIFTSYAYDITFNGNLWIAVGEGLYSIATSPDGIIWTPILDYVFDTGYSIDWNGSLLVAGGVSSTNTIATSSDGITWTGRGNDILNYSCKGIYWNGFLWIAGGSDTSNTSATSPDGINWTGLGTTIFSNYGNGGFSNYIFKNQIILDKYGAYGTNKLDVVADSYFNTGFTNMTVNFTNILRSF